MIASLRGTVMSVGIGFVVIDVGGVGLRVEVTSACATTAHVGSSFELSTQLIVREDALTLFGFNTQEELEVFNLLITVSGVGPRSGLGILAALSPSEIAAAVKREDDSVFRQVSGIGPKTAKLITVSLAGKLNAFGFEDARPGVEATGADSVGGIIVQALVGLGWQESSAQEAVTSAQRAGADQSEAELLRSALVLLQHAPGRRSK